RQQLGSIADGILSHNRAIIIPQDDSVLRLSPVHRQTLLLRRSRGLAPNFFLPPTEGRKPAPEMPPRLALGGDLKSAFAWQLRGNTYISQYLGELGSFETQETFEHTLRHLLNLFRDRPEGVVVDKHPHYFSTQLGRRLALEWQVPVFSVQHHRAHFAAVLAEHGFAPGLETPDQPVLGVVWDGTGYGDDGQVWGGEFFLWNADGISRTGHFEPFDFFLGDKMPREPRLSALSLAHLAGQGPAGLQKKFDSREWDLYQKILGQGGLLHTTSVGRLFDGVAALLGLIDRSSYEGQAALLLEQAAGRFFRKNGLRALEPYPLEAPHSTLAPTGALVRAVLQDREAGVPVEKVAARFHRTLIDIVRLQARQNACTTLAFSGGVWQNALLVDLAIEHLQPEFRLLFHRQLSPNDESIALGQLHLSG
ncbi:MAG: carbamoyltransferase HypF, partial [Saprospiraceae bacterium]|nr:carbamoyltransferase HypF [Saprospiraceae bacterium]